MGPVHRAICRKNRSSFAEMRRLGADIEMPDGGRDWEGCVDPEAVAYKFYGWLIPLRLA